MRTIHVIVALLMANFTPWAQACESFLTEQNGVLYYRTARPEPTGRISDHYRRLMEERQLIAQIDSRLIERGLCVPGGGLCATTSAINILHAFASYLGRDFKNPDLQIQKLIAAVPGQDARLGVHPKNLGAAIPALAKKLKLPLRVEILESSEQILTAGDLVAQPNELILAFIQEEFSENVLVLHAINILIADRSSRQVSYSDPIQPNLARQTYMRAQRDALGRLSVQLDYRAKNETAHTGIVHALLRIRL